MRTPPVTVATHEVHRLTVDIDASYDDFRARYEEAVPPLDERVVQLIQQGAGWSTVSEATRANAPYGFVRYWRMDVSPLMRLAGHDVPGTEYLMGNHLIAERMYAEEPAILLHAPLRAAIHGTAGGAARFVIDQPSTMFASFGKPTVTECGRTLDRNLAVLLNHLGAPVPAPLTAS
ncbi:hypothetical protein GCM10010399_54020 [Dactylosporangium fulvum]|uniref:DUF302 domain-containing protein n=1 Tax=Dactylosporangium fulvum TaxID=53359 RepID=A0ABY5WCL2_9ACTN|nr:hypothetical protein [Dactylosporangium fulvum]UWP87234.1 hypothetical protein Dfulv_24520 [Dactylosporangium fulvum]